MDFVPFKIFKGVKITTKQSIKIKICASFTNTFFCTLRIKLHKDLFALINHTPQTQHEQDTKKECCNQKIQNQ